MLGLLVLPGLSLWGISCGVAGEIQPCLVKDDAGIMPLGNEACSRLEISNVSVTNLDGLLPYTDAVSVVMYDNKNLVDIGSFLSSQSRLFSLNVANTPLDGFIEVQSNAFDSLVLDGTEVRNISISSAEFGSLTLVNNPVDFVGLGGVLDLVIDGSDAEDLDVFDGITTLNRLIVRNTSIDSATIEAFASLQSENLEMIHCGNADDTACE
jgi:hypothetical protein